MNLNRAKPMEVVNEEENSEEREKFKKMIPLKFVGA